MQEAAGKNLYSFPKRHMNNHKYSSNRHYDIGKTT
jgi:hypothetical protein